MLIIDPFVSEEEVSSVCKESICMTHHRSVIISEDDIE